MDDSMFQDVRVERIYEKIVIQIRNLIEEGKLKPGDRLPSERELAITLHCSRTSLREAFRVLESEGLIISKPGGGRFIQNVDLNMALEYRFDKVNILEKSAVLYFLEAREALEPRIVELAAQRATSENIERIEQTIVTLEKVLKNPDEKIRADSSFHLSVAEASQNFVFISMMETNLNMVRQVRRQTMISSNRYHASLQEHKDILQAIKERNVSQAVDATLFHLQKLRENVLKNFHESDQ